MITEIIDKLCAEVIPIYTRKNPDPKTGEPDCPLKRQHKDGKRYMMKQRLLEVVKQYDKSAKDSEE